MSQKIEVRTPKVSVAVIATEWGRLFTISEDNFGLLHHVTFNSADLEMVLLWAERTGGAATALPGIVAHARVWHGRPFVGFLKIWEVDGDTKRSIVLTNIQCKALSDWYKLNNT